jgi:hypothetical protein
MFERDEVVHHASLRPMESPRPLFAKPSATWSARASSRAADMERMSLTRVEWWSWASMELGAGDRIAIESDVCFCRRGGWGRGGGWGGGGGRMRRGEAGGDGMQRGRIENQRFKNAAEETEKL